MINRIVGEDRYDNWRVQRRIISNKFYYFRQQMLYKCFIETPDLANLLGIYPKMDSTHGYGFYSTKKLMKTPTKCIEISKKTPLTVTVHLVCGLWLLLPFILVIKSTTISCLGIGTRQLHAKTERNKE